MGQGEERTGNVRVSPPLSDGPPSGPEPERVSAMRQGVIGKNARAVGSVSRNKIAVDIQHHIALGSWQIC